MKKKILVYILYFIGINNSYCQNNLNSKDSFLLDTIKDYRIKIDGGCSFYSYDSLADASSRIFIISSKKIAFFALKGRYDYIYLNQIKLQILKNGTRKKIFVGKGFKAILITTKGEKAIGCCTASHSSGTLEIIRRNYSVLIKIRGIEDN